MNIRSSINLSILLGTALTLTACGGGSSNSLTPNTPTPNTGGVKTFSIDASAGGRLQSKNNPYVYVDLATGKIIQGLNDDNAGSAANKDKWQIALKRTSAVKLNGGVSGAGDTAGALAVESGYANEKRSDTYINMTAESELGKFEGLILEKAKGLTYTADSNGLALDKNGWGVYNPTTHIIEMTNKWWIIEGGEGSFVKMRVKEYNSPNITLEYYFAKDKDTAYPLTNPKTYTTSLSGDGSECIDFDKGIAITNCDLDNAQFSDWDLMWEKNSTTRARNLWTNGGIIGTGNGGVVGPKKYRTAAEDPDASVRGKSSNFEYYTKGSTFDNGTTKIEVGTVPDSRSGVFATEDNGAAKYGWGEYSVDGNHKMWPNYRVWSIRTGADEASYTFYKLQILSYYNSAGDSGHFKIRSEELK